MRLRTKDSLKTPNKFVSYNDKSKKNLQLKKKYNQMELDPLQGDSLRCVKVGQAR